MDELRLDEIKALMLLNLCVGDEIWSIQQCRANGVPENWVLELQDTLESGFDTDRNTIYVDGQLTNQYHGVSDLKIAYKCSDFLGIDCKSATQIALGRIAEVRALKEAVEES